MPAGAALFLAIQGLAVGVEPQLQSNKVSRTGRARRAVYGALNNAKGQDAILLSVCLAGSEPPTTDD